MSYKDYKKVVMEHFNVREPENLNVLLNINEADQNKVLNSLTGELYDIIVKKSTDIDFGTIPESKGDIEKIENYEALLQCLNTIKSILIEYKQDVNPIASIQTAISNVQARRELFEKSFALKVEMPVLMYNLTVLSIVTSTSLMMQTIIDFIKDAGETKFDIKFDKIKYVKSKECVLFNSLEDFNKSCANKSFDESMEHVIKSTSKQLLGVDPLTIVAVGTVAAIILNIIPILREMVFFFYHTKQSMADFFQIQADLLQVNSEYVKNNSVDGRSDKERKEIAKKQMKIVEKFRKIGNAFEVEVKTADSKAKKDIAASNKKYDVSELVDGKLDSYDSEPNSIF